MNEKEKVVSENELERDGEIILFEGKPFSGVRIDYYENGQKESEKHYKNGLENGIRIEWDEPWRKQHLLREANGKIHLHPMPDMQLR